MSQISARNILTPKVVPSTAKFVKPPTPVKPVIKTIIIANLDIDLKQYGYHAIKKMKADERHNALAKAIAAVAKDKKIPVHDSAVKIMREINLLMIYNRNTHPRVGELMERDRNWIGRTYLGKDYARK
jgi:hypothetical protein